MTGHIDINPLHLPWRTGRKLGRTIYVQLGDQPSDDDELVAIALFYTAAMASTVAERIVKDHNRNLDRRIP